MSQARAEARDFPAPNSSRLGLVARLVPRPTLTMSCPFTHIRVLGLSIICLTSRSSIHECAILRCTTPPSSYTALLHDYLPATFAGPLSVLSIVPATDGHPVECQWSQPKPRATVPALACPSRISTPKGPQQDSEASVTVHG